MRLESFRFRHLGPFGADGVSVDGLSSGLNVIAEHNERGKSSLLAALQLFLLKSHRSADKDVKALSREGTGPTGQIDFESGGRRYRLSKTYLRGRDAALIDLGSGSVIARQAEAEDQVAAFMGADGQAGGPSGLLWVRQGASMNAVRDDGGLVASRIETEMSDLVGGERARDYLARTESALDELVTKRGNPRTGGPLKAAQDALDHTEEALREAQAHRDRTRDIGRELQRVRTSLTALDAQNDDTETERKIAETQAELTRARAAQGALRTAQADGLRHAAEAEQAQQALSTHLETIEAFDTAQSGIGIEDEALSQLAERQQTLRTERDTLDAALADLRQRESDFAAAQTAQANLERLQDRREALGHLEQRLEALDDLLARRARLVETRDEQPDITRDNLDRLAELEKDADGLSRELKTVGARLRLTIDPEGEALLNGMPVKSGPLDLDATSELVIPGFGRIALDAPEAEALRVQHAATVRKRDDWLSDFGLEDYAAAADAMRARAEIANELRLMDREKDQLAPDGYDALIARREQLSNDIERLVQSTEDRTQPDNGLSLDEVRAEINRLSGNIVTVRDELEEIAAKSAAAQARKDAHQRRLAELPETARPDARDAVRSERAAATATAQQRSEDAQSQLDTLRARTPIDPDLLEAGLRRLQQVRDNRATDRDALVKAEVELQARRAGVLDRSDPDADVKALEQTRNRLHEEVARHQRRVAALTLLRETLITTQARLQDAYTAPVRAELAPLLSRVIEGADVSLTEKLGAQGLSRNGQDDDLDRLSGGTREQIAILTRLAFARLLAKGGQPCPVILDDALVYADDARRERMYDVMNYVTSGADPLQLLYLSCHEAASQQLGGTRLRLGVWAED